MSIATLSDLNSAISSYINRTDLTAQYPTWVQMAEHRMAYGSMDPGMESDPLRVRGMETSSSLTVAAQSVALPSGYLQSRRAYISSTNPIAKLNYVVPDIFWTNWISSTTDQPVEFTVEGENLIFGPAPDTSYTVSFLYYKKLTGLVNSGDANWVLTNAPLVYLSAALIEAFLYIRNQPMAVLWNGRYVGACNALQAQDKLDRFSGSPWQAYVDTGQP